MKKQTKNIRGKLKTGVFIDGANLYYSQKQNNWKIDLKKLKKILKREVKIEAFNYYLAVPKKNDPAYKATLNYIKQIKKSVNIKTKPLKYIKSGNRVIKKGDVDVEIVLDVVRNLDKLNLIIVISGDSDFIELRNYVLENNKRILFVGFKKNMAYELKQGKYLQFERIRKFVEYKKITPRRKPGRILLNILYHKKAKKSIS